MNELLKRRAYNLIVELGQIKKSRSKSAKMKGMEEWNKKHDAFINSTQLKNVE